MRKVLALFAPGVTALGERAANYISAVLVYFNENWQVQLFHDLINQCYSVLKT